MLAAVVAPRADKAVQEIKLPLRHEDIIRQQAADKGLDPSLIAGVIYTESRFRDQTSHAGAKGLMQLLPSTADYIARKSGGTRVRAGRPRDAADQHLLRLLVPALPAAAATTATTVLALAAYNAGEGKVDEWSCDAAPQGEAFDASRSHIPFPETRDYVQPRARRARRLPRAVRARARALRTRS